MMMEDAAIRDWFDRLRSVGPLTTIAAAVEVRLRQSSSVDAQQIYFLIKGSGVEAIVGDVVAHEVHPCGVFASGLETWGALRSGEVDRLVTRDQLSPADVSSAVQWLQMHALLVDPNWRHFASVLREKPDPQPKAGDRDTLKHEVSAVLRQTFRDTPAISSPGEAHARHSYLELQEDDWPWFRAAVRLEFAHPWFGVYGADATPIPLHQVSHRHQGLFRSRGVGHYAWFTPDDAAAIADRLLSRLSPPIAVRGLPERQGYVVQLDDLWSKVTEQFRHALPQGGTTDETLNAIQKATKSKFGAEYTTRRILPLIGHLRGWKLGETATVLSELIPTLEKTSAERVVREARAEWKISPNRPGRPRRAQSHLD
jgi:hypothetical protein